MIAGDRVSIIPHRSKNEDGTPKHVLATVVDAHRGTDMKRLDGSAVGFYVDVTIDKVPGTHGYHRTSLEPAP